jgi:hypothetical protein
VSPSAARHVIGANTIDLIKLVKTLARARNTPLALSATAQAQLDKRVGLAEWLPLEFFLELLHVVDLEIIRGDETRALELGANGGTNMRGVLKAYTVAGNPRSTVVAMRHAWRAHFDFGRISCDDSRGSTVRFTLEEYPDVAMPHGMTTAGWGLAAARAAGAHGATVNILSRPWRQQGPLSYDISF